MAVKSGSGAARLGRVRLGKSGCVKAGRGRARLVGHVRISYVEPSWVGRGLVRRDKLFFVVFRWVAVSRLCSGSIR